MTGLARRAAGRTVVAMQMTVRAIPGRELAGMSSSAIADRLLHDEDEGTFSQVAGVDDAWTSDSMILHTAFVEDVERLGAEATPLLRALLSAFERDDLGLRDAEQLDDTVGCTWSVATVAELERVARADGDRSTIAVDEMEISDDELTSADYLDHLRQLRAVIALAAAAGAAIVVSMG